MIHLLDTNVVSAILRRPLGAAGLRLTAMEDGDIAVSVLTAAELRFGYRRVESRKMEMMVEGFLAVYPPLPWDAPCDSVYAEIRTDLERRGALIGQIDMLIAAHAIALDAVLVTDNEREFRRVERLRIENWIR